MPESFFKIFRWVIELLKQLSGIPDSGKLQIAGVQNTRESRIASIPGTRSEKMSGVLDTKELWIAGVPDTRESQIISAPDSGESFLSVHCFSNVNPLLWVDYRDIFLFNRLMYWQCFDS